MAHLSCPVCGAIVEVSSFLALHRWPAVYPEDAAAAVLPCAQGDPLSVRSVLIDDDPMDAGSTAPRRAR
jgi:hypothetical protein